MRKTRVRKIPANIPTQKEFVLVMPASSVSSAIQAKYGLDNLKVGQSFLPKGCHPSSRFNAHGRFILLKDKPKENRYINTIEWEWEQWAPGGGTETKSDFKDIFKECYQREEIPPPSLFISLIEYKGSNYFSLEPLTRDGGNDQDILHGVNLFLEIFGGYEIIVDGEISNTKVENVSWRLLPPGEQPFEKLEEHIDKELGKSPRTQPVIKERQNFINNFNPHKIFVGQGGFHDYVAYDFGEVVILESIKMGNALYAFPSDWEEISKLSKKEIIQNGLAKERIIHKKGWKEKVSEVLVST